MNPMTESIRGEGRVDDAARTSWGVALAERFRALGSGDESALGGLYDLTARRLFGLALWRTGSVEDANDVVQEVFVRLMARRDTLAGVATPHTWLLALTHNVAVDTTRRRKVRRADPLEGVALLAAPAEDPGRSVDAARASRLVATLPEAQRDAIYLRHFADCTFAEIGRVTGVPTFTAASRYRLGLARLRSLLLGKP